MYKTIAQNLAREGKEFNSRSASAISVSKETPASDLPMWHVYSLVFLVLFSLSGIPHLVAQSDNLREATQEELNYLRKKVNSHSKWPRAECVYNKLDVINYIHMNITYKLLSSKSESEIKSDVTKQRIKDNIASLLPRMVSNTSYALHTYEVTTEYDQKTSHAYYRLMLTFIESDVDDLFGTRKLMLEQLTPDNLGIKENAVEVDKAVTAEELQCMEFQRPLLYLKWRLEFETLDQKVSMERVIRLLEQQLVNYLQQSKLESYVVADSARIIDFSRGNFELNLLIHLTPLLVDRPSEYMEVQPKFNGIAEKFQKYFDHFKYRVIVKSSITWDVKNKICLDKQASEPILI
ncbi:hypothetical protein D915_004100 [Fasciola hepatica]|uniref:Uncharacterized protein n=1 Tax=Fasciola hepatica TaxID=6192 RepID=A0A4E0R977_FASHE|nr:hypothetical protein D915_004100 [Fasciola hepatica]